jgi:hypothetical protein
MRLESQTDRKGFTGGERRTGWLSSVARTDSELLDGIRKGDRSAVEELLGRYEPSI